MPKKASSDDTQLSGRGSPALLSPSEPALKMLNGRYHETFALTMRPRVKQVHLFLIKVGLWSLVWTFTPSDVTSETIDLDKVLQLIEECEKPENQNFLQKLDLSVARAKDRIKKKAEELGVL